MRPTNKCRWLPGFTALHSTELGSNPRAVSFMLRDPELLALCLSSCPRQRVFRPVSPLPMPASHGELESQEWFSQQLTQQASSGPRPGCPAGIFHEIRVWGQNSEQDTEPPLYGLLRSRRGTRAEGGGRAALSAVARKDLRQRDQRREETPGQQWAAQDKQLESGYRSSVARACSMRERGWKAEPRGSRGHQGCG